MKKCMIWLSLFLMINGVALYADPCSGLEGLKRLACEKSAHKTKKSRSSDDPSLNTASVIYAPKSGGDFQTTRVVKKKKPKILPHNRKTAAHNRSHADAQMNKRLSARRQKTENQKKNSSVASTASSTRPAPSSVRSGDFAEMGTASRPADVLISDQDDEPDFVMPSRVGMLASDVAYDTGPGVGEDELYKLY